MENGKVKLTHNKHTGPLRMDKLMVTKENTFISMLKNGKIKLHGGALQLKVMLKSTHKKSILNLQNFLILRDKQDPQSKRWCLIWDKSNKVFQLPMSFKRKIKWTSLWKLIHKWISHNVSSVDLKYFVDDIKIYYFEKFDYFLIYRNIPNFELIVNNNNNESFLSISQNYQRK